MLSLLHIPAALLLALLAGVCDFLPVIGFLLSAGPAVLMAMTVSATAAYVVAGAYVLYHVIETITSVPRCTGVSCACRIWRSSSPSPSAPSSAASSAPSSVLPLAAIYPVIERVWLSDALGTDVRVEHRRVERTHPH